MENADVFNEEVKNYYAIIDNLSRKLRKNIEHYRKERDLDKLMEYTGSIMEINLSRFAGCLQRMKELTDSKP